MSNAGNEKGWRTGARVAVGTDLEGEHVLISLEGQDGSLIRFEPQQALALATAIRATARRIARRSRNGEGS